MDALAAELGALTPEQAAAPVNTVEVSEGTGIKAPEEEGHAPLWRRAAAPPRAVFPRPLLRLRRGSRFSRRSSRSIRYCACA